MADVLVVGGGVIGLLSALELRSRGADVALVDASDIPSASWAGGGILAPLFPWRYSPAMNALCHQSVARYQALSELIKSAGGVDPQVREHPLLAITDESPDLIGGWAKRWHKAIRQCDAGDYYVHLRGRNAWRIMHSGSVRNPRLLKGLRHLLLSQGVTILDDQLVSFSYSEGGVDVTLRNGKREARQLVIAMGHHSHRFLTDRKVDFFPAKGEMLRYEGGFSVPPEVILSAEGYLIPRDDGSILVGSTLEPGVADICPTEIAALGLKTAAAALWPELAAYEPVQHWAGVRPGHGRDVPIIDCVDEDGVVWLCTGHYRNGLTAAPASAQLLVDGMCSAVPKDALAPYSFSSPGSSDSFCKR